MLEITIPEAELFDESTMIVEYLPKRTLQLEHSLLSISKWESKWHVPFLESVERTEEQLLDYIKCMTVTKNVDPSVYRALSRENVAEINAYIENPMTATTIRQREDRPGRQIITSELIYYWMIALEIPFECEKWHLNRLLMLIQVCNAKNAPAKKMGKKELAKYNSSINAARRARSGSRG